MKPDWIRILLLPQGGIINCSYLVGVVIVEAKTAAAAAAEILVYACA